MFVLKTIAAMLITVVVLVVVTYCYIVVRIPGPGKPGQQVGIDVALLPSMTIYSPMFWSVVVAVMAILWWALRRWLFDGS